jgi:hypothetical protein
MSEPKTPRSKPVICFFFIIVVFTIVFGIVATFRMGTHRGTPTAAPTNSVK